MDGRAVEDDAVHGTAQGPGQQVDGRLELARLGFVEVDATASLGTLVTDDRASTRQPDRLMAMRSSGTTMTYLSYQARS